VWVYLGRGVATNALPRGDTLPPFLSSERVKDALQKTAVAAEQDVSYELFLVQGTSRQKKKPPHCAS